MTGVQTCALPISIEKNIDTDQIRTEASALAANLAGQAERAAEWVGPRVTKAAGEVARAAKEAQEFKLDEVVVTATRTPKRLSQSPVITQVVTAQQIEDRGLSDIKSLLTQEIPGLVFNEVGFGTSINLQGLGGKHILFLVDGERMAGETGDNIDYQRLDPKATGRHKSL